MLDPHGKDRLVPIDGACFTIGRRPGNDLVLAEKDISRVQAEIRREEGSWVLEDKGSLFGTAVNGETVERRLLRNRDLIAMGRDRQFEMVFLLEDRVSRILEEVGSRPHTDSSPNVVRNLSILLEISKGLNSTTSLQDLLELSLDAVLDVTQAERGFLMLRDDQGRLTVRVARKLSGETLEAEGLRFSRSIVEEAASTGQPRFLTDVQRDDDVRERSSVVELALRSVLCLPLRLLPVSDATRPARLVRHGDLLGIIYADSSRARGPLPDMTRDLITSIAVQTTLALENFTLRQDELERRLAERELEREMERMRETDRIKSEFLSNVSHELRTPLTAIKGSLQNMLDGLTGPLEEKQRRSLSRMHDNTEHLARLINDLLDLSLLETGSLALERRATSVTRLLEDAAEALRPLAERRGVALKATAPSEEVVVIADRGRLMQVLFNLIGNALKFTPPGGQVTLSAGRREGSVVLSVTDTGPGIPARDLERIFDRFVQLPGPGGAKTGGAGLGLPIARSLVELHGGSLWAESGGAGSRFQFTLPSPAAPAQPEAGPPR
ncbi:MAG TPA: ATP-binding protein [Candidatus Polarisedimenticolia bacterium]|nr:ATP-binding protein [Candidatus Polarisedimenticolia bacterium]